MAHKYFSSPDAVAQGREKSKKKKKGERAFAIRSSAAY